MNGKLLISPLQKKIYYEYEKYSVSGKVNSHKVLGQEFDNVAVVIDDTFF